MPLRLMTKDARICKKLNAHGTTRICEGESLITERIHSCCVAMSLQNFFFVQKSDAGKKELVLHFIETVQSFSQNSKKSSSMRTELIRPLDRGDLASRAYKAPAQTYITREEQVNALLQVSCLPFYQMKKNNVSPPLDRKPSIEKRLV